MYTEYVCYDYSLSDKEIKHNITAALQLGIDNIGVHSTSLTTIKSIISSCDRTISLSTPIDFPYGICDSRNRLMQINTAIKAGANVVDVVAPAKFISNRKYEKLRDDITNNILLCNEHGVALRYILEYRVYNHETLAKTCQILKELGVGRIIPSTGIMIDDINDNIIASKYLSTKSQIDVICNGNIWQEKHIKAVVSANIYGLRVHHLSNIEILHKNIIP